MPWNRTSQMLLSYRLRSIALFTWRYSQVYASGAGSKETTDLSSCDWYSLFNLKTYLKEETIHEQLGFSQELFICFYVMSGTRNYTDSFSFPLGSRSEAKTPVLDFNVCPPYRLVSALECLSSFSTPPHLCICSALFLLRLIVSLVWMGLICPVLVPLFKFLVTDTFILWFNFVFLSFFKI